MSNYLEVSVKKNLFLANTLIICLTLITVSCDNLNTPSSLENKKVPTAPTSYYIPDGYYYSADHEWVKVVNDSTVQVGLTSYGLSNLGQLNDIVVYGVGGGSGEDKLPKRRPKVVGNVTGSLSSANLMLALECFGIGQNNSVLANPSLVNLEPYTNWIYSLTGYTPSHLTDSLMSPSQYRSYIGQ